MRIPKNIALITSHTLTAIGLQALIEEYFPPAAIHPFTAFDTFSRSPIPFDYFFIESPAFIGNTDYFLQRRSKTVILHNDAPTSSTICNLLNACAPAEIIIEQLKKIFSTNIGLQSESKELTSREIDVLQLIVQGNTNKDIADKLHISFNTVLTHRKNITAKLGVKTTAGLTFYALMNGIC